MAEVKHTPGPWRVYQCWVHPSFDNESPQGTNGDIAICEPLGPNRQANAHLIAASPELLKACKAAIKWHEGWDHQNCIGLGDDERDEAIELLYAAIAKAEKGEVPCKL